MDNGSRFQGWFDFVCRNPDGSVAWEERVVLNGTTTVGLNSILSVYFNSGTQITTWYAGLIDSSGFSSLGAGDTIASHSGWAESTAYSESTRRTWTPGSPAGGVVTGSVAVFTMNATATIKGGFLVSENTKGGTSGTLWCTAAFGSTQSLVSGQTLTITYTCTATGS
jgi:hypothetical protein